VERNDITAELASRLVAAQFPQWAGLPVRPVEPGGWDNRTFRLGAGLSVRLPSGAPYALQVSKEHRWLPALAPQLPLPVPVPIALGAPGCGYPWPWSVCRWLPGVPAAAAPPADLTALAADLAGFLAALYRADPAGGPEPGEHNFLRGAPVRSYDAQTRDAIRSLGAEVDAAAVTEVWEAALAADWPGPPVWVHGDVADGNLLVDEGRLRAVIDFGCCAVGDPACDTVIAWTLLSGESREAFRELLPVDPRAFDRGRGWALWKALIVLARVIRSDRAGAAVTRRVIDEILADYRRAG
jgi:aminoglycoside phosphotransferase (APT) family kinase protein